jgi:hypothetical protein
VIYQRNDSMLGPWQLEDVLRYYELGRKWRNYLGIGGATLSTKRKNGHNVRRSFCNQKGLGKTVRYNNTSDAILYNTIGRGELL